MASSSLIRLSKMKSPVHAPRSANPNHSSSPSLQAPLPQFKAKGKRAAFPPPEPTYYNLDPSLAQTIKPKISPFYLSKAKDLLGPNVEIITANPEISIVDHCSIDPSSFDVGVHIDSVKCGLRFPLHPFISEFFNAHEIIPAQLAPNGYRFLVVFLNVCQECNIPPSLPLFHYFFDVEPGTILENKGFVIITSRRGRKFVVDLPSSPGDWKKRFFKVRLPPSQISFVNGWSNQVMSFPTPGDTPELLSQVKEIARVSRSCDVYATTEKIDILYGLKPAVLAAPEVPVTHMDREIKVRSCLLISVFIFLIFSANSHPIQSLSPSNVGVEQQEAIEAEEDVKPNIMEEYTKKMAEKIKALKAQLFFARQAGVDDFKKSKEFQQSGLEYIHNNLEAFLNWELTDEGRRENFFKIMEANPNWIEKKVKNHKDGYYSCQWSNQKSIYDRLMAEFDVTNAAKLKTPKLLAPPAAAAMGK